MTTTTQHIFDRGRQFICPAVAVIQLPGHTGWDGGRVIIFDAALIRDGKALDRVVKSTHPCPTVPIPDAAQWLSDHPGGWVEYSDYIPPSATVTEMQPAAVSYQGDKSLLERMRLVMEANHDRVQEANDMARMMRRMAA